MTDTTSSGPYARAAQLYWDAGWRGVLPIGNRAAEKFPPPHGFTGHGHPMPSYPDVVSWTETHGERNIGLRLERGVLGIDVDAYDGPKGRKTGGETLAALIAKLGPLPPTWVTGARTDGVSGIRLYRVPTEIDGVDINWPGEAGPNIELVHYGHRYANVWPSVNPEAGGAVYGWSFQFEHEGDWPDEMLIPNPATLPELPLTWVNGLRLTHARAEKSDLASGELAAWWESLAGGEPCRAVARTWAEADDSIRRVAGSRHEKARDAAAAIARFGGEGHAGARAALDQLGTVFNDAVGPERARNGEWNRLLDGAVRLAARAHPVPAPMDPCRPPALTGLSADFPAPPASATPLVAPTGGALTLPDEFWRARPSLSRIRTAAHARVRSADVVFYGTLVRLASMAPPWLRLDTGVGSAASTNLFAAIVSPSGAGKSSGLSVARELYPVPEHIELAEYPLGSGEGIAESFMGQVKVDDPSGAMTNTGAAKQVTVRQMVRHNVLLHADEGSSLNKLLERTGSTVGETLRSGWSGEQLGQKNGRDETTRQVPAGSYSLGLLIGYQPTTVLPLLADVDAGTPQRFLFGWAIDPTIPPRSARVEWPGVGRSPFPPGVVSNAPADASMPFGAPAGPDRTPVTFAQEIRDELYDAAHAKATGATTVDPFQSQHPVLKVKVAFGIATLDDGRRHVTAEDWRLAQIVIDTSDGVREHLRALARDAAARERAASIAAHAELEHHAEHARRAVTAALTQSDERRLAVRVATWVHRDGALTLGALRKRAASRDRPLVEAAVELAVDAGWLVLGEVKVEPGPSVPALG